MKKLYILAIILCVGESLLSQDFHLSQYDAGALNTNPALTGMFEGKHRFHIHYRQQWTAIASRPFTTSVATYDNRINNKWAWGVQLLNYNAGAGMYNAAQIMPSLSYSIPLSKNKFHRLTLGASAGAYHKSLDFAALTWGEQYIPDANGGSFDQGISSGESYARQSLIQFDVNAGALYWFGRPGSRYNPFVGFTAFHLNESKETFYNTGNVLPRRYLGHAGMRIGINETISIIPKVFYQFQEEASEITASLLMNFYLKKSDIFLIAGGTFRNEDAIIADVGFKAGAFEFRMSYDFNYSSLKTASTGRGATELSLTYIIFNKVSNPLPSCPRL